MTEPATWHEIMAQPDIGRRGADRLARHAAAQAVLAVLPAEIWSACWSQQMGLNVDNPFEGHGNLTRVVSGVTLHRWQP